MIEQHLTAVEVAARLKVHVSTIFRAASKPPGDPAHLRSIQIGRSRRFPESAVEEWLQAQTGDANVGASVISIGGRR